MSTTSDRQELTDLGLAYTRFVAADHYVSVAMGTNEQAADKLLASDWLAEHDRAVAAAAWDEGEDAGRRSIPRPNPYANALITDERTENNG